MQETFTRTTDGDVTKAALHHATGAYAGDQPIERVIFETRTADAETRDRGLAILRALDELDAWRNLPSRYACQAIVRAMCERDGFGKIEPWSSGLVVRRGAKEVAVAAGLSERSAYEPLRILTDPRVAIVRRIPAFGNRSHDYEIPMPPPAVHPADPAPALHEERAPSVPLAAQSARAPARAALASAANDSRNPLTEPGLARAAARAALDSAAPEGANAGFSTQNPRAALAARAPTIRTSTCTNTYTSTCDERAGTGERGEGEWFMPWLLSLQNEKGEPMKPWVARKWGGPTRITPELQHAIWHEVERVADKSDPRYSAAGLAVALCKSPPRLSDVSWEYAKQQLAGGGRERRAQQYTGSRIGDLFNEPETCPFSVPLREGQTVDERATEIQQTIDKARLLALHKEACQAIPPGVYRMCVGKAEPRLLKEVHALIVQRVIAGVSKREVAHAPAAQ